MSDNNHWTQPESNPNTGQGGGPPPREQVPAPMPGAPQPSGGDTFGDFFTKGWGVGAKLSVDDIRTRFSLVFKRASGSVLKAWLLMALVPLTFLLIASMLGVLNYYVTSRAISGILGVLVWISQIIAFPVVYAATVGQWALFKPLHRLVFEDPVERLNAIDTIKSVKGVYFSTLFVLLAVSLVTSIGFSFCFLPGLFIAFILSQSVYLTAARGLSPMDAMKRSVVLNKAHWESVVAMIAVLFIVMMLVGAILGVTFFVSTLINPFGMLLGSVVYWAILQLFSFAAVMLQVAVFSSIETQETGQIPVQ